MTTKSYAETMRDLASLDYYPGQLREQIAAILSDGRLSTDYQKQLIAQAKAQAAIDAKSTARQVYQRAKQRIERTEAALAQARQAKDDGLDWQKLSVLSAEYGAKLKNAPTQADRLKALDELISQAGVTREGRRALSLAASDYLVTGDLARQATAARATLRQWAEAEAAPVHAAEVEAHHAKLGLGEIEAAILRSEAAVTGTQHGSWMPLSEWERDILSRTPQNTGRIVWRDELQDYANTQGAPSPVPPGVLSSSK